MSKTVRGVVVGHGDFAAGLVSAVRQICGRADVFVAVSNRDYPAEELERVVSDHVDAGAQVVFTDLPAGSAAMAARRVMRTHPGLILVTGANLGSLLEFAMAERADPLEAARIAVEKGRACIDVSGGS